MMRVASSLTNRIFLASTLLAVVALGLALYFVDARVSAFAEGVLLRGVTETATLVERRQEDLTDNVTTLARSIADLPKLKGTVDTEDRPTVQPLADEYRARMNVDVLLLTGRRGQVLGDSGADPSSLAILDVRAGTREVSKLATHRRGLLQVISVPLVIDTGVTDLLGRLSVGFFMDDALAKRLRELTGSEVAFAAGGRVVASSFPPAAMAGLQMIPGTDAPFDVELGGEEYLAYARPMPGTSRLDDAANAMTIVLRSRADQLRVLRTLRAGMAGALLVAVLLATVLSYFVARTVTRPLAAVTDAMRDVAATGDLTRKVTVRSRAWDDEDARVLGTAFNTLTDSIALFQKEAGHKDRLTSLGRLSTVIAHEIRNPLMIIRASLATLWSDDITPAERRDALSDIDEETKRLNRIVTEVLDFSKPIRFELGEAQVNDICRASAAAAWAGSEAPPVTLDLDPAIPTVVTDAERLRTALVNILTNARHATEQTGDATPAVLLSTRERDRHIVVTVRDRGAGIAAEDLAHVFDPFFTTRRTGTGLGLPIAKNIIDGLGGVLFVSSDPAAGTEIRIELPLAAASA